MDQTMGHVQSRIQSAGNGNTSQVIMHHTAMQVRKLIKYAYTSELMT